MRYVWNSKFQSMFWMCIFSCGCFQREANVQSCFPTCLDTTLEVVGLLALVKKSPFHGLTVHTALHAHALRIECTHRCVYIYTVNHEHQHDHKIHAGTVDMQLSAHSILLLSFQRHTTSKRRVEHCSTRQHVRLKSATSAVASGTLAVATRGLCTPPFLRFRGVRAAHSSISTARGGLLDAQGRIKPVSPSLVQTLGVRSLLQPRSLEEPATCSACLGFPLGALMESTTRLCIRGGGRSRCGWIPLWITLWIPVWIALSATPSPSLR